MTLRLQFPAFADLPTVAEPFLITTVSRAHHGLDLERTVDLVGSGRITFLATGTPVRITDDALTAVRVVATAGPDRGRGGWVPRAWIRQAA